MGTRDEMMALLKTVQRETGVTVLHVTPSHGEAERLVDRLFVVQDGRIREDGGTRREGGQT